jgi:tRNA threonylcarbamoyladenosine biosynthesis protein TsaB
MAIILNIETATQVCSVALADAGQLLALKESSAKNSHSSTITLFIEEVLKTAGINLSTLDAIAVSAGPGSYTGLRIGVATAKGLCYALGRPLIAVSTLKAMAEGMRHEARGTRHQVSGSRPQPSGILHLTSEHPFQYCPMIDARRMEVFNALYDESLKEIREPRAEIINENSFSDLLARHKIIFGGDGAEKCKLILGNHKNAIFLEGFQTSASYMIALSEDKFHKKQFEDPAYFEPFYLKDFVAGKPRVKGLH